MTTPLYVKKDGQELPLGRYYFGGKDVGRCFGFVPLNENLMDSRVLQPGNDGYGEAMLLYWDSLLLPEDKINVLGVRDTTWAELKTELASDETKLTNDFVGSILLWRGKEGS